GHGTALAVGERCRTLANETVIETSRGRGLGPALQLRCHLVHCSRIAWVPVGGPGRPSPGLRGRGWLAGRGGVAGDLGGDDLGDLLGVVGEGGVSFAQGDADLAGDGVWFWVGCVVFALV